MSPADRVLAKPLRVLIVGGGIGGLCLAQALKRAGISFAVCERDHAPDARLQGYRLNIEPIGAAALHECLPPELWSLFVATAGDAGASMGIYDEHLRLLMREDPRPASAAATDRAHAVSRATLRRLLLAGLEAEVSFGKEFVRFERLPDNKLKAIFADGDFITGDVLVGADGVNSRVCRQLLPDARLIDTGGIGIGGKLPLNADVEAWLPSPLLLGKNMILPERDFLFTAMFRRRMSSSTPDSSHALAPLSSDLAKADADEADYIMWAYVARKSIDSSADSSAMARLHGEALRSRVEQSVSHWHAGLRRLIAESDASSVQLFDFRAAARIRPWQSTNVTLVGDAAHAMPPVGGIGGNIALCDAAKLSRALKDVAEGKTPLVAALSSYEADMLKRGFAAVGQSRLYLQLAISPSRMLRAVARAFFRACGAAPSLRRAVFGS